VQDDFKLVSSNMPDSRRLMAVPFVGKDVPSHASEFAHPDILIGLTILAYRYVSARHLWYHREPSDEAAL
jgi:hypothetical protein